jgi:hypothetical protein
VCGCVLLVLASWSCWLVVVVGTHGHSASRPHSRTRRSLTPLAALPSPQLAGARLRAITAQSEADAARASLAATQARLTAELEALRSQLESQQAKVSRRLVEPSLTVPVRFVARHLEMPTRIAYVLYTLSCTLERNLVWLRRTRPRATT